MRALRGLGNKVRQKYMGFQRKGVGEGAGLGTILYITCEICLFRSCIVWSLMYHSSN